MSQNFSNNSDIFIPELIELDSYWQKAVEDAICDTLKGEKRLLYALRNRKKINQKLEKLGLKPVQTQLSFQKSGPQGGESNERLGSGSDLTLDEGNQDVNSDYSKTENDESRQDKNQRTPDRPLLAAGSLEKMKKSQNSFNYEPMGVGGSNDDLSESNDEDVEDHKDSISEKNKKIQWLHVRDDGNFDDSDSETAFALRKNEKSKNGGSKHASHKDKNFVMERLRLPHDAPEGSQGEEKSTPTATPSLRRKMHLTMSKKDIIDTHRASSTRSRSSGAKVKVKVEPTDSTLHKRKQDKSTMPPFIRFYLELYRKICHKYSPKHITEEAARRWWSMSDKQKSLYSY